MEECRINCESAIHNFGKMKVRILDGSIKPFIKEFEKIAHVELTKNNELNESENIFLDEKSYDELKKSQSLASSLADGLISGTAVGALTAFGAYSAVGSLATASTGTAISALSGAAATNATLAFLGGGSMAVGGLGIAGGTAVLGGLITGPALAIMGTIIAKSASEDKNNASINLQKAQDYCAEVDQASLVCINIRKRANIMSRLLVRLDTVFQPLVYQLKQIIKEKGVECSKYSKEEQDVVAEVLSIAGLINTLVNTPILDKKGNLTKESDKKAAEAILFLGKV